MPSMEKKFCGLMMAMSGLMGVDDGQGRKEELASQAVLSSGLDWRELDAKQRQAWVGLAESALGSEPWIVGALSSMPGFDPRASGAKGESLARICIRKGDARWLVRILEMQAQRAEGLEPGLLGYAVRMGAKMEAVEAILASGADPDGRDEAGRPPLLEAVALLRSDELIVRLSQVCDLSEKDDLGNTVWDLAGPRVKKLLLPQAEKLALSKSVPQACPASGKMAL